MNPSGTAGGVHSFFAFVFPAGGKAAPDMPLGFVYIQKLSYLPVQGRIQTRQAVRQILMYGGFGYAEMCGCGADGGFVLNDVHGQIAGALFNICTHMPQQPSIRWQQCGPIRRLTTTWLSFRLRRP